MGSTLDIDANDTVRAAKNLRSILTEKYGATSFLPEWPIQYLNSEEQVVSGWVDLTAVTPKGLIIIDHKTFPGSKADWYDHAV